MQDPQQGSLINDDQSIRGYCYSDRLFPGDKLPERSIVISGVDHNYLEIQSIESSSDFELSLLCG
jgi:hypothetical protein